VVEVPFNSFSCYTSDAYTKKSIELYESMDRQISNLTILFAVIYGYIPSYLNKKTFIMA